MKRMLIHVPGLDAGKLFSPDARDNVSEPFIHLRARLKELGYRLETADRHLVRDCRNVIVWDLEGFDHPNPWHKRMSHRLKRTLRGRSKWRNSRGLFEECLETGTQSRMALILGEPAVVLPANWNPAFHELFPRILTWNDDYVDGSKYQKLHWPLPIAHPEVPDVPFRDRKLLVNISGNKFSSHPKELYSARRDTIRSFERSHPDQFDLYGVGWADSGEQATEYPSYRGTIENKWDVYPNYRFGVCYENMCDEPGWITEKIFDSIRAGCVPIYWGASNIRDYVDPAAFIDRTSFGSDDELSSYLSGVTEAEFRNFREAGRDYLESNRFKAFLSPAFADSVIRLLDL